MIFKCEATTNNILMAAENLLGAEAKITEAACNCKMTKKEAMVMLAVVEKIKAKRFAMEDDLIRRGRADLKTSKNALFGKN